VSRPALTAAEAAALRFLTTVNRSYAVPLLKRVVGRSATSRAEDAVPLGIAAASLPKNVEMTASVATEVTPAVAQSAALKDGSAAPQANAVMRVMSVVPEVLPLDRVAVVLRDISVAETLVALKMKLAQMVPASLHQRPRFQYLLRNPLRRPALSPLLN
jgi:hypothetical protein